MSDFIARETLRSTRENLPNLYKFYNDPDANARYDFNQGLYGAYRCLATLDYRFYKDVLSFKENLKKAVLFKLEAFEKFDEGFSVGPSFVTMNCFKVLFDALASGDMPLAMEYAKHLGNRPKLEREYDDDFTLLIGYSLKYAVEDRLDLLKVWLPKLISLCENTRKIIIDFLGYALVFEAILENNADKASASFQVLLDGHRKRSVRPTDEDFNYSFCGAPDEHVCVWGIGLANLCRHRGLLVQISDPLIPEELLIESGK